MHEEVKYSFKLCSYEATTKGNFQQHQMSFLEGIKHPYKRCSYEATQKGHFKEHQKASICSSVCPNVCTYVCMCVCVHPGFNVIPPPKVSDEESAQVLQKHIR